jgi:hypothetical protein
MIIYTNGSGLSGENYRLSFHPVSANIVAEAVLDRIKDANVIRLIERIGEHYRSNVANRFLRPVLLQLQIDKTTWDLIEILTEKMEQFRYHGFHLDELYRQIAACAHLVDVAKNKVSIRIKIKAIPSDDDDKVLLNMTANNFSSNLQIFADLLYELYTSLVEIDKKNSGNQPPVYTQIHELYNIGQLTAGRQ